MDLQKFCYKALYSLIRFWSRVILTVNDDQKIRERALDPTQSFIVQAPAGSGKTGLLIQRFLILLSQAVEAPEECLAITFTRKAASEMQDRIMVALQRACDPMPPIDTYEHKIWQFACAVLKRDKALGWNLIQNPNRLKIMTIDALCASLTKQMPIVSQLGAALKITEQAHKLYEMAANQLLTSLETEEPWSSSVRLLLAHLDNNLSLAGRLLANMLSNRDQWLPYIGKALSQQEIRAVLEKGLKASVEDALQIVSSLAPRECMELLECASFAAKQLKAFASDSASFIIHCEDLPMDWPKAEVKALKQWLGLAELLLTEDNVWRKTVTVKQGFPSKTQAKTPEEKIIFQTLKQKMCAILETFTESNYGLFREALEWVRISPPLVYEDRQWKIIESLITLLPILVAELSLVFQEQGQIDFTEVSLAASRSLGSEEFPTDLALGLDYKIRHILVDEFQDTSIPQFRLLKQLTAGWQPFDGKTLFLVGDPMQAIYRFRQAEVGLFLQVKQKGIGDILLTSLVLTTNFRSDPKIVNWVNTFFKDIFPKENNISSGAITYSDCYASKKTESDAGVEMKVVSKESEASLVVELIQSVRSSTKNVSIAVLVRSRSHLKFILPALQKAGIDYNGVQLELLSERPVVQDLMALTRALLHLGNTIAWLSILRMPGCDLPLEDLVIIVNFAQNNPLWHALLHHKTLIGLSDKGKKCLLKIVPILQEALNLKGRLPLSDWILETFVALGGAHYFQDKNSILDAETFFSVLGKEQYPFFEINDLEEHLKVLYAKPKLGIGSREALQIMTIHKAKGLEFDIVIVPGLGLKTMRDESQLLLWSERMRPINNEYYLLFAPIKPVGSKIDSIYHYLKKQEEQRILYESNRVLYVAATRAKKQLYWLTHKQSDFSLVV